MNDIEFFSLLDIPKEEFDLNLKLMVMQFLMIQNQYLDKHCKRDMPEPIMENFLDMMSTATEKAIQIMRERSDTMTKEGVEMTRKELGL